MTMIFSVDIQRVFFVRAREDDWSRFSRAKNARTALQDVYYKEMGHYLCHSQRQEANIESRPASRRRSMRAARLCAPIALQHAVLYARWRCFVRACVCMRMYAHLSLHFSRVKFQVRPNSAGLLCQWSRTNAIADNVDATRLLKKFQSARVASLFSSL
jgi:hypothetical protein